MAVAPERADERRRGARAPLRHHEQTRILASGIDSARIEDRASLADEHQRLAMAILVLDVLDQPAIGGKCGARASARHYEAIAQHARLALERRVGVHRLAGA